MIALALGRSIAYDYILARLIRRMLSNLSHHTGPSIRTVLPVGRRGGTEYKNTRSLPKWETRAARRSEELCAASSLLIRDGGGGYK